MQLAPALGGFALATQLAGMLYDRQAAAQGNGSACKGSLCFRQGRSPHCVAACAGVEPLRSPLCVAAAVRTALQLPSRFCINEMVARAVRFARDSELRCERNALQAGILCVHRSVLMRYRSICSPLRTQPSALSPEVLPRGLSRLLYKCIARPKTCKAALCSMQLGRCCSSSWRCSEATLHSHCHCKVCEVTPERLGMVG